MSKASAAISGMRGHLPKYKIHFVLVYGLRPIEIITRSLSQAQGPAAFIPPLRGRETPKTALDAAINNKFSLIISLKRREEGLTAVLA
jgi:hypothetical protein